MKKNTEKKSLSAYTICIGESKPVTKKYSRLNRKQTSLLEQSFAACSYPKKAILKELALQTGLKQKKIFYWFRNRRQKAKKKCGEYFVCL